MPASLVIAERVESVLFTLADATLNLGVASVLTVVAVVLGVLGLVATAVAVDVALLSSLVLCSLTSEESSTLLSSEALTSSSS